MTGEIMEFRTRLQESFDASLPPRRSALWPDGRIQLAQRANSTRRYMSLREIIAPFRDGPFVKLPAAATAYRSGRFDDHDDRANMSTGQQFVCGKKLTNP